jgi:hypothetical protein
METLGNYNKALVAVIMGILLLIENWTGWRIGLGEPWVETLLAVLTPIFVWLVPNRQPPKPPLVP